MPAANLEARHLSELAIERETLLSHWCHTLSTKLSTTRFSPALSNAMVSLLPSIAHHIAVAELLVKHAVAEAEGRGSAGGLGHQLALDGERRPALGRAGAAGAGRRGQGRARRCRGCRRRRRSGRCWSSSRRPRPCRRSVARRFPRSRRGPCWPGRAASPACRSSSRTTSSRRSVSAPP